MVKEACGCLGSGRESSLGDVCCGDQISAFGGTFNG